MFVCLKLSVRAAPWLGTHKVLSLSVESHQRMRRENVCPDSERVETCSLERAVRAMLRVMIILVLCDYPRAPT